METKLLTRDAFREGVFLRDNHQCVITKLLVPKKLRRTIKEKTGIK